MHKRLEVKQYLVKAKIVVVIETQRTSSPAQTVRLMFSTARVAPLKDALQLLINRYGKIRFAQVPERVSTTSFVVLIMGNSKSFHFGAQGTFKDARL